MIKFYTSILRQDSSQAPILASFSSAPSLLFAFALTLSSDAAHSADGLLLTVQHPPSVLDMAFDDARNPYGAWLLCTRSMELIFISFAVSFGFK